jgi:molecular chaperone Hsp33
MTEKESTPDLLIQGNFPDALIRFVIVQGTQVCKEAESRHLLGRLSATAISRCLISAMLLSSDLSEETRERVTLQLKGEGALPEFLVEVSATGNCRGYASVQSIEGVDSNKEVNAEDMIGKRGHIGILRHSDKALMSQGAVAFQEGDVLSELRHYLKTSEQIESLAEIVINYDKEICYAGGVLIQIVPGYDKEIWGFLKERIESGQAKQNLPFCKTPHLIASRLFQNLKFEVEMERELRFSCTCSRERVRSIVKSMGFEEAKAILKEYEKVEVDCKFCSSKYDFLEKEINEIFDEA